MKLSKQQLARFKRIKTKIDKAWEQAVADGLVPPEEKETSSESAPSRIGDGLLGTYGPVGDMDNDWHKVMNPEGWRKAREKKGLK